MEPVKKFKDVKPNELLDGCNNPATPRNSLLPKVWSEAADPCKIWKRWPASTFGALVVVSLNSVELSWLAPTSNVDGSAIAGAIDYEVFRGFVDSTGKVLIVGDTTKPLVKVAETKETTVKITKQPSGVRCYAVRAVVGVFASTLSNAVCKTMKIPGPTNGKIEGPTDGGIEIK